MGLDTSCSPCSSNYFPTCTNAAKECPAPAEMLGDGGFNGVRGSNNAPDPMQRSSSHKLPQRNYICRYFQVPRLDSTSCKKQNQYIENFKSRFRDCNQATMFGKSLCFPGKSVGKFIYKSGGNSRP